mmetsp:Transcript_1239/g.3503  ORF Transcript_1239/g.3503 Transcript_1239/m.3503 type:complete len:314 (+) Transcript_1239:650-1591(+)
MHVAEGLAHKLDLAGLWPLDVQVPGGHRAPQVLCRDVLLSASQRQADAAHVARLLLRHGLRLVEGGEELLQALHRRQRPVVDLMLGEGEADALGHVAKGIPHPQPVEDLVCGDRVVTVQVRDRHDILQVLWGNWFAAIIVMQKLLQFLSLEDPTSVLVVLADDLCGINLLAVEPLPQRQPLRAALPVLRLRQLLHGHVRGLAPGREALSVAAAGGVREATVHGAVVEVLPHEEARQHEEEENHCGEGEDAVHKVAGTPQRDTTPSAGGGADVHDAVDLHGHQHHEQDERNACEAHLHQVHVLHEPNAGNDNGS